MMSQKVKGVKIVFDSNIALGMEMISEEFFAVAADKVIN